MVFQSYALFPHMSVLENVVLRPASLGRRARPRRDDRAREGAGAASAWPASTSALPSELSGGQQQRVAVARALVLEPAVLLFDEPLSNLDARLRRQMREEIRELQQRLGLTVVYVTHDQRRRWRCRDRIIVMDAGRIAQEGAPRELYERPRDAVRRRASWASRTPRAAACAGWLTGKVAVRLGDSEIEIADTGTADGEATVAVRPEAITVELAPGPRRRAAGTIAKASYLGTHMEYSIDTAAGTLFATCPQTGRPLAPGAAVALVLSPRGVIVVEDQAA